MHIIFNQHRCYNTNTFSITTSCKTIAQITKENRGTFPLIELSDPISDPIEHYAAGKSVNVWLALRFLHVAVTYGEAYYLGPLAPCVLHRQ